jgi:hypothetical protein
LKFVQKFESVEDKLKFILLNQCDNIDVYWYVKTVDFPMMQVWFHYFTGFVIGIFFFIFLHFLNIGMQLSNFHNFFYFTYLILKIVFDSFKFFIRRNTSYKFVNAWFCIISIVAYSL